MPLRLKLIAGIYHVHGTVAGGPVRRSLKIGDKQLDEHAKAEIEGRELRKSLYGAEKETTFAEAALVYLSQGGEKRYLAPIIEKLGPKKRISELSGGLIRKIAKEL